MLKALKLSAVGLLVLASALVTGCQSSKGQAAIGAPSTQAIACDKCKVTYVQVPIDGGKGRITGYRSQKRMECADCRSHAENFFRTGKFEHTCKTCGDTLSLCDQH